MNDTFNTLITVVVASVTVIVLLAFLLFLRIRRRKVRQSKVAVLICAIVIVAMLVPAAILWHKPVTILHPGASVLQQVYRQSTSGSMALFDPLYEQDRNNWDTGVWDTYDSCSFTAGAYHIKLGQTNYYGWCIAEQPSFSNFAFQVQMTILKGDGGGILFRSAGKQGKYYAFSVGEDGSYELTLYYDESFTGQQKIQDGTSAAIKTGPNATNIVTVVAKGGNIYLYVNKQSIVSIYDTTYSTGQIGLVAEEESEPTDVAFQNVEVWKL
jgi:Domain of Unknown Function (DUF1080)